MSQENLEIAARMVEAFNAGDAEAALAAMHSEVEFIPGGPRFRAATTATLGYGGSSPTTTRASKPFT